MLRTSISARRFALLAIAACGMSLSGCASRPRAIANRAPEAGGAGVVTIATLSDDSDPQAVTIARPSPEQQIAVSQATSGKASPSGSVIPGDPFLETYADPTTGTSPAAGVQQASADTNAQSRLEVAAGSASDPGDESRLPRVAELQAEMQRAETADEAAEAELNPFAVIEAEQRQVREAQFPTAAANDDANRDPFAGIADLAPPESTVEATASPNKPVIDPADPLSILRGLDPTTNEFSGDTGVADHPTEPATPPAIEELPPSRESMPVITPAGATRSDWGNWSDDELQGGPREVAAPVFDERPVESTVTANHVVESPLTRLTHGTITNGVQSNQPISLEPLPESASEQPLLTAPALPLLATDDGEGSGSRAADLQSLTSPFGPELGQPSRTQASTSPTPPMSPSPVPATIMLDEIKLTEPEDSATPRKDKLWRLGLIGGGVLALLSFVGLWNRRRIS